MPKLRLSVWVADAKVGSRMAVSSQALWLLLLACWTLPSGECILLLIDVRDTGAKILAAKVSGSIVLVMSDVSFLCAGFC